MQLSANNNAFQVIFPKYAQLFKQSNPTNYNDQSLQMFIRDQLPSKVQLVRSLDHTFTSFINQFNNLIIKRPKIQNLIQSLLLKASEKIDKYFHLLQLSNQKSITKNSLQNQLSFLNFQQLRQNFRQRLKSLNSLIKQKYFDNHNIDRPLQQQICKRLYNLNQIYYFMKNDLSNIGSKYHIKQHQILSSINNNQLLQYNNIQIADLLYLNNTFIQSIHEIVSKRCRPFLGKKDFFYSKLRQIQNQSQSKVPMNINLLINCIISKQKYRVTKQLSLSLSRQLRSIDSSIQQQNQIQCKQLSQQFDSLKKQYNQLKNNIYYLDIVRGSFIDKYKMQIHKLQNVYYLSNLEKYLQDVSTFTDKLIRIEERVIENRKQFIRKLGQEIEAKIVDIITEYQIKAGQSNSTIQTIIDSEFQALESSLYGVIKQENYNKHTYNHNINDNKNKKIQQAENRRKQIQFQREQKQKQRKKQMQQRAMLAKIKQQQQKSKLQQKRRQQQQRLRKIKQQRQQKQKQRLAQQNQKQQQRKLQMQQKMEQKRRKDQIQRQRLRQQTKRRQQQKRQKQLLQKQKRQKIKLQKQQQQKRKKQQLMMKKLQSEQQKIRKQQQKQQQQQNLRRIKQKKQQQQKQKQKLLKLKNQRQQRQQKQRQNQIKLQKQRQKRQKQQKQQNQRRQRQKRQKQQQQRKLKSQKQILQRQQQQRKQREQKLKRQNQQKLQQQRKLKELKQKQQRQRRQQQNILKAQKQRKQKQQEDKLKRQKQQKERKQKQQRQRKQRQKQQRQRQRKQKQQRQKYQRQQRQKREKQQKQRQKRQEQQNQRRIKQQKQRKDKQQRQKRQRQQKQRRQKQQKQRRQKQQQLKKQKQLNQRKLRQQKQRKQRQQRQKRQLQALLQQQQKQKAKKGSNNTIGSRNKSKGGSGINYNDFDDICDDDLDQINKQQQQEKEHAEQYGQYDDDFQSPQKQGQQQQGAIQIKQLINEQSIKCLNDYIKGTSYARKNKPNLQPFNNNQSYQYIFQQFLQARKMMIFDSSYTTAILQLSRQLLNQDTSEQDLKITIQSIREQMLEYYVSKTEIQQFHPLIKMIFPFSFQTEFDIKVIEIQLSTMQFRPVLGKAVPQDEQSQSRFNAILQAFLYIFEIENQPQINTYVLNEQSSLVLSTFQRQIPTLLTIFAMHYEKTFKGEINITQYTVQRFFYSIHALKPLYEQITQNSISQYYEKLFQKYTQNEQIKIVPLQIQSSNPDYDKILSEYSLQTKAQFLQNSKQKITLIMFQVMIQQQPQDQQQQQQPHIQKTTIYCSMQKTSSKPIINYYIVAKDTGEQQNANTLFEIISQGDDDFDMNVYMDYTRHNGLTQYSDWTLPLWAKSIQKRKLTPIQAFRAITFAMVPYYIAFKEMD